MPTTTEGKCPKCLTFLTYLAREVGVSCVNQAVHCSTCGWTGEEISEIEFLGHTEEKTPNKFLVQEGTAEAPEKAAEICNAADAEGKKKKNEERAARAEAALRAYAKAGGEQFEVQTPEEYLIDVVTDLRHYAAREGCDWPWVELASRSAFLDEKGVETPLQPEREPI